MGQREITFPKVYNGSYTVIYTILHLLLIIQERYQYMYLTRPSPEWDRFKLSQLCHVDMRLLLFNCLYEARNPSLYQSVAKVAVNTCRSPPLLHLDIPSMSAFDCLSLGYFLFWVCHTVNSETSVHLYHINGTCIEFLVKGLTEGITQANSCTGGSVGSLYIQLEFNTWEHDGLHYLTQLMQSEGNCISRLKLVRCQHTILDIPIPTKECRLALCMMLQRNTTLKSLSIADFRLTQIITDIAEELKHNCVLETVEFEGYIGSIGLKLLAEIISYNKHLKALIIKDNYQHSADGAVYLIEALKHNNTLQIFTLRGVFLTVPQLELLANALTINTTLEKLQYSHSVSKAAFTAHTERLWTSGVLHQLLTIALERTMEWFGEQETIKAVEAILLEWHYILQS